MDCDSINQESEQYRTSSENLMVSINKLYVDCLGLNVGQDFLELMDLKSLQEHFHKVYRYSGEAAKLKNLAGIQHSRLVGDTELYVSRLKKIQDVSNSMIQEIVLAYRKLLVTSKNLQKNGKDASNEPFPAKVEEILAKKPVTEGKTVAESNPQLDKTAIPVTTDPSLVLETLKDYQIKFEDIFRNSSPDNLPELQCWFNFDSKLNPKLYDQLFSDEKGKASPEFKEKLQTIFTNLNWKNYSDKQKQFDLIDPAKIGEQLEILMDYIHQMIIDKKMNKESFAIFETFFNEYFELVIYQKLQNDTDLMPFIQFKHLLSFKIRSMFYSDFSLNIDHVSKCLNNARWITILCKSYVFDPNIMLICLKYLINRNDRFHLECFVYMIEWFGIESMKQLDQPKNSIETKFIDSIFDQLSSNIVRGIQIPSPILDKLKDIIKLRTNNWSN